MNSFGLPPPPTIPVTRPSSLIKWLLGLGALCLVVLGWSCGTHFYRDYVVCRSAVDRFHQHLNRGEYESIYSEASDDFRSEAPKSDEIKVLETVHEKMGIAGTVKPLGFHVNSNTKGTLANQVYETEFSLGKAEEQFVWRIDGSIALLVSYHAESPNFR